MLENLTLKQKIIFIVILIFMIAIIVYYIYSTLNKYSYENTSFNSEDTSSSQIEDNNETEPLPENSFILVHISGCVKNEMVVTLKENSRIQDAIDAAGGLTKDADLTNINLAYILEDGEKIYIPKKGENLENSAYTTTSNLITSIDNSSSTKNNKININKASQTELETINGIGPSTAQKILDYRNKNGKFKSIEDIKNISGIGKAKYDKIKDYISVK